MNEIDTQIIVWISLRLESDRKRENFDGCLEPEVNKAIKKYLDKYVSPWQIMHNLAINILKEMKNTGSYYDYLNMPVFPFGILHSSVNEHFKQMEMKKLLKNEN